MEGNTDHKPAPYIRRRAFSKVHIQSWLIYLERDGFVRCSFQNCNFMAFDVEEMGDHYAFCKGSETLQAKFVCSHCHGRAMTANKLQIHLARAHNITGPQTSTSEQEADKTKDTTSISKKTIEANKSSNSKPSRVLLASWQCFYDSNNYVKCASCSYIGNTVREMNRHYHFCKQEKEMLLYVCPECKGRTMNINPLLWHMERSHKLYREAGQFNLITHLMLKFWEKELKGKHHTMCLHVSKGERDCFYFADDLLAIIEHSQSCKGPKFSIDKKQCTRCPLWTLSDDVLSRHMEIFHPKLVVKRDDKAGVEVLTIGPASETIKKKSKEATTTQLATITSEVEIIPVDYSPPTEESREALGDNHLSSPIGTDDGNITKECGSDQSRTEESDIVKIKDNRLIILSGDLLPGTDEGDEESSLEIIKGETLIKRLNDDFETVVTSFHPETKTAPLNCKNKPKRPIEETHNSKVINLTQEEDHACGRNNPPLNSVNTSIAICKNHKKDNEIVLLNKNNSFKFRKIVSEENNHHNNKVNKVNGSDEEFDEVDSPDSDTDNVFKIEVKNEVESPFPNKYVKSITDDKSTKELKMETYCGLFEDESSADKYDDLLILDTDNRNNVEGTNSDLNEVSDKIDMRSCPKNYLRRHIFKKAERFSPIKRPSTSTAKGDPKHLRDRLEGPETVNIESSSSMGTKNESFKNKENSTLKFEHNKNSQNHRQVNENCVNIGNEPAEEISKCSEKNDKLMLLNSGSLDISENCIMPVTPQGDAPRSGLTDCLVNGAHRNDIQNENHSDLLTARSTKFLKCVGIGSKSIKDIEFMNSLNKCSTNHLVTVESEADDCTSPFPINSEQINSINDKNNPDESKNSFFCMKTYNIKKSNCWKIEYDSYESDAVDDLDCEESILYERQPKTVPFFYQGKFSKHEPVLSSPAPTTILKQNSHYIKLPFCKRVPDSKNEKHPGLCSSLKIKSDCQQTACGKGASYCGKKDKRPSGDLKYCVPNKSIDSKMLTDDSIDEFTSDSSRRISSDWCEDSSHDEEFLGTDEEPDMKDKLFNGFQDVTEQSCSMNRRFHQFLNRLSESENEEWYVNAGNLSMEVRKQEHSTYGKPPSKLSFHSTHNTVKTKSIFEKPLNVESKDVLIRSGINRNKENHKNEVNSQSYITENLTTSQFKSPSYFSLKEKVVDDESKCMDKSVDEENTQASDNEVKDNSVNTKRCSSCNNSTSSTSSDIKNVDYPDSSQNLITKSSIISSSAKRKIGRPPKKLDLTGLDGENKRRQESEVKNDKPSQFPVFQKESHLCSTTTSEGKHTDKLRRKSENTEKGNRVLPSIIVSKPLDLVNNNASGSILNSNANMNLNNTDEFKTIKEVDKNVKEPLHELTISEPCKESKMTTEVTSESLVEQSSTQNTLSEDKHFSTLQNLQSKSNNTNSQLVRKTYATLSDTLEDSDYSYDNDDSMIIDEDSNRGDLDRQSANTSQELVEVVQSGEVGSEIKQIDSSTESGTKRKEKKENPAEDDTNFPENHSVANMDTKTTIIDTNIPSPKKRERKQSLKILREEIEPIVINSSDKADKSPSWKESTTREKRQKTNKSTIIKINSKNKSEAGMTNQGDTLVKNGRSSDLTVSSTPKRRGRPPKKIVNMQQNLLPDDDSSTENEILISIYSEEAYRILHPSPTSQSIVNLKSVTSSSVVTKISLVCESDNEKTANKKSSSTNSRVISDTFLSENISDSSFNASCVAESTPLPKKRRGRPPKVKPELNLSTVTNESSLNLKVGQSFESLNISGSQDSTEISNQTVGPKKRGRKPKLKQDQSNSEPVKENKAGLNEGNIVKDLSIHIPKRRGRPPKSKINTVNMDNNELTPTLIKNDTLNDSSVNLESEVDSEIYIPKKRGRKPKQVPPIDKTQNCCIIQENEVNSVTSIPKKRGRKPKQIYNEFIDNTANNQSDGKESVVHSTPKRRGRPPKKLVENEQKDSFGVKKGSKRQFYEEDNSDEENSDSSDDDYCKQKISQKRLKMPPNKRKLPFSIEDPFFKTRHGHSDRVVCGVCKEEMSYHTYKAEHAIFKHYMLCWLHDEENPVDMNNDKEVVNRLWYAKKRLKAIPFRCFSCNLPKLSAVGFQSHIRFCGKDAERESLLVTCELCGSKLMPSSLNAHNYMKHNSNMTVPTVDPALIIPRMKRAAANRAVEVIQSQTDDGDPGESQKKSSRAASPDSKHFLSHLYSKPSKVIPPEEYSRWKTSLQDTTIVECHHPQCNFTANSTVAFRKHYFSCKFSPPRLFRCKKCEFACQEETRVQDHVLAHHHNELEDAWSDSDGSDGSEGENSKKYNLSIIPFKFLKKLNRGLPKRNFYIEALNWTQELREEILSTEELFEEAMPSAGSWQPLSQQQAASHLPLNRNSLRFRGSGDTWQTLRRFDATLVDGVPMIFTGGPVWASAWAPVPDTEVTQYLAVASHPSMEHTHQMSNVYNYKSLIQIWAFGHLSNTDPHSGETPRFLLGLCHSRGSVWALQWCPSGCYQTSRLGLLAAACSDGSIVIYAIPRYRYSFESVQEFTMYNAQPMMELKLGCEMMSQCKCLDWHSVAPHSTIVGGFANGMVAIWDLTTTSPLLREGITIYPYKVIEAHLSAVTAVSLSPTPLEEARLMTASLDRATKFWRLEDTTKPVSCLRKASVTDAVQPAHWLAAISSYDDVFSINSSHITGVNYRETFQASNTNYHLQPATVWSLSFNDWLNVCACASEVGKVSVFFRQQILVTEDSKKVKRQSPIGEILNCSVQPLNSWSQAQGYGISYSEATSNVGLEIKFKDDIFDLNKAQNVSSCDNMDRYPLQSINKVTWNPNFHSFTWMAVGMQCGLVLAPRLKNIPLKELTQLYVKSQDDR